MEEDREGWKQMRGEGQMKLRRTGSNRGEEEEGGGCGGDEEGKGENSVMELGRRWKTEPW